MSNKINWFHPTLEARVTKEHGRGIFATQSIKKGARLAIFGGDVLRIDEVNSLPEAVRHYPLQIEERFVLWSRSATTAEDADLFNHSCEPNSGFKGQLFLVAMRDIQQGEEITFDYAMCISESVESTLVFKMECACDKAQCRKVITEQDWKLPELRKKYAGYFSQYLLEKINLAPTFKKEFSANREVEVA